MHSWFISICWGVMFETRQLYGLLIPMEMARFLQT